MTLDLQFKLKSNPLYIKYLHENSYWYKILNREPNEFNNFIKELQTKYKLRPEDRINNLISTIETITNLFNALK